MGIVLAQRAVGGDPDGMAGGPGGSRRPPLPVGGRIFEVAVLHQLGIESAVGGIADVLEEGADEMAGSTVSVASRVAGREAKRWGSSFMRSAERRASWARASKWAKR